MKDVIRLGYVPDQFTAAVSGWIARLDDQRPVETLQQEFKEDTITAVKRFTEVLRGIWLACVVEPEFTVSEERAFAEEPPFHIDIVDYDDLLFLFQWAQGVDQTVESFLREQADALGGVVDGKVVSLPTQ